MLQRRLEVEESHNEEHALSIPMATRPLVRRIEAMEKIAKEKEQAFADIEARCEVFFNC